jgi:hypothetical protein
MKSKLYKLEIQSNGLKANDIIVFVTNFQDEDWKFLTMVNYDL